MRNWSVPPLVALFAFWAGFASLCAADDPGDVYLQGFQAFKAAEREEQAHRLDAALQKYKFCLGVMQQIQKTNPDYEPLVVDFRLKKSRDSIARVTNLLSPSTLVDDDVAPTLAGNAEAPLRVTTPEAKPTLALPELPATYRLPGMAGDPAAAPLSPSRDVGSSNLFEDPAATMQRGMVQGFKDRIRELQLRLGNEQLRGNELEEKLLTALAQKQSALTELDREKVKGVERKAQLDQAQQALADAQQNTAAAEKKIVGLQSELEAAKADLEVANEYNDELFTKLEQASKFIDASEKIRTQLLAERKELSGRAGDKGAAFRKVERERDEATVKVESLQKRIEDAVKLAEQNKELSAKLTAAEVKLTAAAKSREEREKIEGGLRDEIATVDKTLATMREQLSAAGRRIVDLEKQLAETSSATAIATGAMADENTLLKSLVARQINEQAKRQQARRLVQEEMEKLQIRSTTLLDKLNALGSAETELTPKEKRLFDRPVAGAGNGVDFSLSITKKEPESDLPEDLRERAKAANELSNKSQFKDARAIYEEIAQKAPQSYIAAINLGITERQLGENIAAISAFKRALEIRPNDAYALTNLGKTELNAGDLNAAVETLRKAVNADSASHYGHYLLALALHQNGAPEEARQEVERALELNPGYLPAAQLKAELGDSTEKTAPFAPKSGKTR